MLSARPHAAAEPARCGRVLVPCGLASAPPAPRAVPRCSAGLASAPPALRVVHRQHVFIEHTDAQGLVFNANYLRFATSARELLLRTHCGVAAGSGRCVVVRLGRSRLAASAVLGDELEVCAELCGACPSSPSLLRVRHTVSRAGDARPLCAFDATVGFVDAVGETQPPPGWLRAQLAAAPPDAGWPEEEAEDDEAASGPAPLSAPHTALAVPLHSDELGPGGNGLPGTADLLRWLERGRTAALGGGAGLASLQATGCLVVVTHLGPMRVHHPALCAALAQPPAPPPGGGGGACPPPPLLALEVRTRAVAGRRGFIEFQQQVLLSRAGGGGGGDGGEPGAVVLAAASVTCACVDAATGRLAAGAPPGLADTLARLYPATTETE